MSASRPASARAASKPVPDVPRLVVGVDIHQFMELGHQTLDHSSAAARELGRIEKDETVIRLASLIGGIRKRDKVRDVFSDNSSTLQLIYCKKKRSRPVNAALFAPSPRRRHGRDDEAAGRSQRDTSHL